MPRAIEDLTGRVFGRLTVIGFYKMSKWNVSMWNTKCFCGKNKIVLRGSLLSGNTKSCGCLQKEKASKYAKFRKKHGLSKSYIFNVWSRMKARCYNKNDKNYESYGARGIFVCNEWMNSLNTFYNDMGDRPSKNHSIDRIDNNKGYYKENCRWATKSEQCLNRRKFKNSTSKYKGVHYKKSQNRFIAIIFFNKKKIYIGSFKNELDAAKAYVNKKNELFGVKLK